jgi:hypothetical protein
MGGGGERWGEGESNGGRGRAMGGGGEQWGEGESNGGRGRAMGGGGEGQEPVDIQVMQLLLQLQAFSRNLRLQLLFPLQKRDLRAAALLGLSQRSGDTVVWGQVSRGIWRETCGCWAGDGRTFKSTLLLLYFSEGNAGHFDADVLTVA